MQLKREIQYKRYVEKQQEGMATDPNDYFKELGHLDPESKHKRGFNAEDIVDWFKIDRPDDCKERD